MCDFILRTWCFEVGKRKTTNFKERQTKVTGTQVEVRPAIGSGGGHRWLVSVPWLTTFRTMQCYVMLMLMLMPIESWLAGWINK